MKIFYLITVTALSAITLFSACKSDSDAVREAAVQNAGGQPVDAANPAIPAAPASNPATPPAPEPAQNATGVWHYTCPKGCAGGGGAAAPCAKCGTTLAHNTAYHPAPSASPATTTTTTATPVVTPGATTITPPPAATPEPAQNKAGVWHYTCAAGCAGGGGSATACAKCGKTLAHNATYHQ